MDSLGLTHISLAQLLATRLRASQLHQQTGQASGALSGLHFSRLRGRGMEFDQVRAWQPGDNARHIDWRASARACKPQIRLFHEERDRPVFILLEQSPSLFFASSGNFKSVQAALLGSLLAWLANARHDRVGGLVFASRPLAYIPPQRHTRGVLSLLHSTVQANQALQQPGASDPANNPLTRALEHSLPRLKPETLVILLCDESHLQPANSTLVASLIRNHDSLLIPLSDPMEQNLAAHAPLTLGNGEAALEVQASATGLHSGWRQQARHQRRLWQQLAASQHTPLLPLTTATSVLQQWHQWHQSSQEAGR